MEKTSYPKEEQKLMQHQNGGSSSFEDQYYDMVDLAVHDLDAPLRKLSLLVGMLTNKLPADKDLQSLIGRIIGCVGDMRSLIDDLSVLAKLDAVKPEWSSCNIDLIIKEALQDLPLTVKERQAIVTTLSLPVIEGDRRMLDLLFKNLLENSITFNKKDQAPKVHIDSNPLTTEEKLELDVNDDRLYHKIEISDNGLGFKNENAEKIFRPFVRLHGKSQFEGSGIGLAICRKIIDIHHGIIYAEGRENAGARFIIILPESRQ